MPCSYGYADAGLFVTFMCLVAVLGKNEATN
jgi:hypothetical protein